MVTAEQIEDYPEGTVLPVGLDPDRAYVKGSEKGGQGWYLVFAGTEELPEECECKGFRYHGRCKHLERFWAWRQEQAACPICEGAGFFRPNGSVRYVGGDGVDMAPVPLPCCMGEGTREAWLRLGSCPAAPAPQAPDWWSSKTEEERRQVFA